MADEQAQNSAPDAPEAPASDVQNGAVNDTTATNPEMAPSESLPPSSAEATGGAQQAEANPSEPVQPVSEGTAQPETSTPQTPVNEPLDIPPFDNSPTPLPQAPAPASAPQARSGRDLLVKARATIQQRKEKKLEKILSLFATKPNITNDEVEKLLHVSDATATRYLSELEKQGKIRQVGKTGHAVSYTKI